MIAAILNHYKLLLTFKHNGTGLPYKISPTMMVFIAAYCVFSLLEIVDDEYVLMGVIYYAGIASVCIYFVPQVFVGLVLINAFELVIVSLVDLIVSNSGVEAISSLSSWIHFYSAICVIILYFNVLNKRDK